MVIPNFSMSIGGLQIGNGANLIFSAPVNISYIENNGGVLHFQQDALIIRFSLIAIKFNVQNENELRGCSSFFKC